MSTKIYYINTIEQRFLTQNGMNAFSKESTKWDIIRVFHWMHQYAPTASELRSGDYFYGPRFNGDGSIPNIFKFTMYQHEYDYECKFEQVECNESNLQKVTKYVKMHDFSWFKAPTGKYNLFYHLVYIYIYIGNECH